MALPSEWPPFLQNLFVIALGLVVGSFLNVVIYRLPRKMSISFPASHCPECDRPLRWYENIPVLSYLGLGGKCSSCKKKIPLRYPVVELLTALLFVAALGRYGWSPLLFIRDLPLLAALVAVTFIDLDHRIIPDRITLPGVVWGVVTSYWVPDLGILLSIAGAALGFAFFYTIAWAYQRRSGQMGLGGGDIKLLAMMGAFVGPLGVFTIILIGSLLGSVIGIVWGKVSRENQLLKTSIPFGPFLVIGCLYYSLLGELLWLPFNAPM